MIPKKNQLYFPIQTLKMLAHCFKIDLKIDPTSATKDFGYAFIEPSTIGTEKNTVSESEKNRKLSTERKKWPDT